ncbi:hypothetical protein Lfu02_32480 [Longispora fulva]|uniref:DnaJ-class molecular chaperone n=1 Tax=Longispora fulva TaxID=619741 RepID=A0A8J7GVJ4_9ACTN|nr:DnaJ-class molecular chaperone [Longispora fulva]GIG58876.1 hypothetical protein Lfu02_32480 [Longispora fulva]
MNPRTILASTLCLGIPLITLGYALACAYWPFAACRRCTGSGKRRSPLGRAWRDCRRCKGTGRRIRTGRRIFTFLSTQRRNSR